MTWIHVVPYWWSHSLAVWLLSLARFFYTWKFCAPPMSDYVLSWSHCGAGKIWLLSIAIAYNDCNKYLYNVPYECGKCESVSDWLLFLWRLFGFCFPIFRCSAGHIKIIRFHLYSMFTIKVTRKHGCANTSLLIYICRLWVLAQNIVGKSIADVPVMISQKLQSRIAQNWLQSTRGLWTEFAWVSFLLLLGSLMRFCSFCAPDTTIYRNWLRFVCTCGCASSLVHPNPLCLKIQLFF